MATTPKTVRTFTLDGSKKDFTIPFEYLARKFVVVTLIGATRRELILNTEFRFSTATTITTTKAWGPADNFDLIEIRRLTSATERLVDFADGSILRAYDLNISQVQSLHIAEEARDLTADTIGVNNDGDLDARARKIVNLADGVNDGDAVNLRQQKQWAGSALNQAQASAASASQSAQSAANSQASAVNSASSASSAATSATNSASSASNSATQRAASEAAKTASEAARDLSQAWASKAEDNVVSGGLYSSYHYSRKSAASASASQTSASNSASSASFATTEANRATTQADRAKTEADKLANANAFMGSLQTVDATNKYVRFMPGWSVRMDRLWVDDIYGMNSDKVSIKAGTFAVSGAQTNANGITVTSGGLNVTGAATMQSGLTVNGNFQGASGIFSQSLRAGSVMQVIPQSSNTENTHFWFRDLDASTERALIYADSGRNLHIRTNVGNSGEALVRSDNSWSFGNAIEVTRGTRQTVFFNSAAQLDGAMYGNCQLQLQGTGGGVAALGFHNAGRVAGALWLNTDNQLWWMQNSGNNQQMTTNQNVMNHIGGMTADQVGSIASMYNQSGSNLGPNAGVAGSSLRFASHNNVSGTAGSGSWRCLGSGNNGGVCNYVRYA